MVILKARRTLAKKTVKIMQISSKDTIEPLYDHVSKTNLSLRSYILLEQ